MSNHFFQIYVDCAFITLSIMPHELLYWWSEPAGHWSTFTGRHTFIATVGRASLRHSCTCAVSLHNNSLYVYAYQALRRSLIRTVHVGGSSGMPPFATLMTSREAWCGSFAFRHPQPHHAVTLEQRARSHRTHRVRWPFLRSPRLRRTTWTRNSTGSTAGCMLSADGGLK